MNQEQIFGAATATNPYSMADNPSQACAYHEGFEAGARWHLVLVEEAFKQWLSKNVDFTFDEGNRDRLNELWDKIKAQ